MTSILEFGIELGFHEKIPNYPSPCYLKGKKNSLKFTALIRQKGTTIWSLILQ